MTEPRIAASHPDAIQAVAALPNWSESMVMQVNDPAAGLAVWAHLSRMPAAPLVWECDVVVYEGDHLFVSRSFHRNDRADEAGGEPAMRCAEAGQVWEVTFDSMARRILSAASLAGPLTDGDVEMVTVQLRFDGLHPVWSAGGMDSATWAKGHVEQAGRIRGVVNLGGRDRKIDGFGFRDHSYGPRDYSKLIGNTWATAVFPDGTAMLALAVWSEPLGSPPVHLGYLWDGETFTPVTDTGLGGLPATDGGPRNREFTASFGDNRLRVEVELTHRAGFTLQAPVGMSLGATPEHSELATVVESAATLRWNGKTAYGWYEQNMRRSNVGLTTH